MASKQKQLALKVRDNIKAVGMSHAQLTDSLGCGATLVSMFTGDYHKEASKITLFVLGRLADPACINSILTHRKRAKDRFPSAMSVIRKMGKGAVMKFTGVTEATVNRWKTDSAMMELWEKPSRPRISIAALRLMALGIVAQKHQKPQPDLFDMVDEPKKVETLQGSPQSGTYAGRKVLSGELRKLADTVEDMPLDSETHKTVYKLIGLIKATLREVVRDRKKKLEEELEALKSLGV